MRPSHLMSAVALCSLAACSRSDPPPPAGAAPAAASSTAPIASASASTATATASAKRAPIARPIGSDEGTDEPAAPIAPAVRKPFAIGKFDAKALPPEVKLDGPIEAGLAWSDAFGDNLAVATRRETKDKNGVSVHLRVRHFASSGGWKQLREIRDQSERCAFDNVTAFRRDSFAVDDADKDGVGELRFAYVVDCVSDVSPQTAKLVVLEGGAKRILRGETLLIDGDERYGGTYTPDPAPSKWNPKVLDGARAAWKTTFGAREK